MTDFDVTILLDDGTKFIVKKSAITRCKTIESMLEEFPTESDIELPVSQVANKEMAKIIAFCEYHSTTPCSPLEKEHERKADIEQPWDDKFIEITFEEVLSLAKAADYLHNDDILQICGKKFAQTVSKYKTVEALREALGVKNDFTPQEEEQINRENSWVESLF
jgi:S-phase kinase-associated protein 1